MKTGSLAELTTLTLIRPPDRRMALRMLVYIGLLSQHLIREGELHNELLSPIVPIVLHNGPARWKVPQANIHELDEIDDVLKENTMKGVRQGVQQGMQQGRQEGFAELVALQLNLRFGSVTEWAQERLAGASQAQLTQWAAAMLTAQSLIDLFGVDGPTH